MSAQRMRAYGLAAILLAAAILAAGAYFGTGESRESRVEHAIAGGALDGPGSGPAKPPPGIRPGQTALPNMSRSAPAASTR